MATLEPSTTSDTLIMSGKGEQITLSERRPIKVDTRVRVLIVFGTRPEAIKMAPVIHEFLRHPQHFEVRICVTAQHRELLDHVLALFRITPHYDLDIMRPGQSLEDVTSAILTQLTPVLAVERPNWMLVQGDTTTAMAASLAATYQQRVRRAHRGGLALTQ